MFLAKKRIAIAYEDGFKEGLEEVRKARRKERAALEAKVAELTATKERLQEELRQLRAARAATPTYY